MRLLLDTHALVWWLNDSPRLSVPARAAIEATDSVVHVSVATAWEISIKVGQSKWPEAAGVLSNFEAALADEGFALLSITVAHVRRAGLMPSAHRDPFDRLLAGQAMIEGLTPVTADKGLASLGAPVHW